MRKRRTTPRPTDRPVLHAPPLPEYREPEAKPEAETAHPRGVAVIDFFV